MIKSIKLKLWLALFVTLVLSLGTLLALSFFSVKQQFLDYATHQILERLAPLEQEVLKIYQENQSLHAFQENPKRWQQLRDATYRKYLSDQNRAIVVSGIRPQDWSEKESIEDQLQPNQRAFFQHIVLFDESEHLIAGRPKENANYILRKILLNDKVIAHIGYVKPQVFLRSVDKLFVEQQVETFSILTALMILVAVIVTVFLSRWLVKPLTLLTNNADRVAGGDFSVRVHYSADDELGVLCQNFNKMAASLEKNEDLRKQWVADISHEMRTPLSVLKAQLEAMEDGIREPNKENIQLLQRNIDALATIINDLYELSLTDVGSLNLNKERFAIVPTLDDVIESFNEKFVQKNIAIEKRYSSDVNATLFADENRVRQLLSNLLENSYRYTDTDGRIIVNIQTDDNETTIVIEDSAPGVPEDALNRIYDRLYRVESSRSRETGGSGLGLSICQGIMHMHNGSIHSEHSTIGGLKQLIVFPNIREQHEQQ